MNGVRRLVQRSDDLHPRARVFLSQFLIIETVGFFFYRQHEHGTEPAHAISHTLRIGRAHSACFQ